MATFIITATCVKPSSPRWRASQMLPAFMVEANTVAQAWTIAKRILGAGLAATSSPPAAAYGAQRDDEWRAIFPDPDTYDSTPPGPNEVRFHLSIEALD